MKNLFLLLLFTPLFSKAQVWEWARNAGDSTYSTFATSIATDATGNVYVVGHYEPQSITFGGITLTDSAWYYYGDMFVVKYNAAGDVLWARNAHGPNDQAIGVTTDAAGNVYVVGQFISDSFRLGTTTLYNTGAGTGSIWNLFIVKYDADGNVLWARSAGSDQDVLPNAIVSDPLGNTYVNGIFWSPFFNIAGSTLAGVGSPGTPYYSPFIIKYDSSGNATWARTSSAPSWADIYSLAIDNSNNVVAVGAIAGPTITFDSATFSNTQLSNMYIVKYSPTGNVLWARSANDATNQNEAYAVSADAAGNVYAAGFIGTGSMVVGGDTVSNPVDSSDAVFIIKYDTAGNVLWVKSSLGNGACEANALVNDAAGNLYIAGDFSNDSISIGGHKLINAAYNSIFLAKLSPVGGVLWADTIKGSPYLQHDAIHSLSQDEPGNGYVTGVYTDTICFGSTSLGSVNGAINYHMFAAKMNGTTLNTTVLQQIKCPLSIYPNPAHDMLTIATSSLRGGGSMNITNVLGQIVADNYPISAGHTITIDVSQLPAGMYFVKTSDGCAIAKFVKE